MTNGQIQLVVIDDDTTIGSLLGRNLEGSRWQLTYFSDEELALDYLATHRPTVLIVDVRMPKFDGDQILDALAPSGALADTRILASSSVKPPRTLWNKFQKHNAEFVPKDKLIDKAALLNLLDLQPHVTPLPSGH